MIAVERLFRRIQHLLGYGRTTTAPNEAGTIATVQIKLNDLVTRDGTPVAELFGFASSLPVGTDVVLGCCAGDLSNGIIIASNHQQFRPKGMAAGESQQHDAFGKSIYLTQGSGIIVNANGAPVTVNNATLVTINASTKVRMVTPRLEVTGDVIDNCDTQTRTMAAMRSIYDGHTHPVSGVAGGSATVNTQAPTQQE